MKIFKHKLTGRLGVLFISCMASVCYADRVILFDENGKHLMTSPYSDIAIEAMKKDAQSSGLDLSKVTVKKITEAEWQVIEEEQIKKSAREKAEQEKLIKQQKETEIKAVLGLSDENWQKLKDVLNGN